MKEVVENDFSILLPLRNDVDNVDDEMTRLALVGNNQNVITQMEPGRPKFLEQVRHVIREIANGLNGHFFFVEKRSEGTHGTQVPKRQLVPTAGRRLMPMRNRPTQGSTEVGTFSGQLFSRELRDDRPLFSSFCQGFSLYCRLT